MPGPLTQIRDEERAEALWASATVFLVLVAHSLLETARDALFLAHLPTSHLPWVYLTLAFLAILGTRTFGRSSGPRGDLRQLIIVQFLAAAGTACFLVLTQSKPPWALYALYLWGGLASTLILIRFWLLLGDRCTPSQAKRLFPIIAAAALLGSLVGYAVAGIASRTLPAADLLGLSAVAFLLSAGGTFMLWRNQHQDAPQERATPQARRDRAAESAASIVAALRHPYVRRVAAMLLIASVTVTLGDFIFKSVVAKAIPAHELGSFLALAYFGFDVLALIFLFAAVAPFVRARGVTEALALQPALLLGGGVLLTALGGLGAVVCLRCIDGALRWSLHKTATELLYVPLSSRLRGAVKGVSDVVGHRGGQALASVLILGWLALSPSEKWMGPVVIACAALWIYLAVSLRQPYLDLFRETLSHGSIETRLDFPDLDFDSLETLITALSSPDDDRVLAAMHLLQQSERVPLIPTLLLYHPSPKVIDKALELFSAGGREDFLPLTERLLRHPDATVRAAAMRARARLQPDLEQLRQASTSESEAVAVTAVVALAARGELAPEEAEARLEPYLKPDSDAGETRSLIARALRDYPAAALAPLLARLGAAPDTATRREAVLAMGVARNPVHLPMLVGLLARREVRPEVRAALLAFGQPAFDYLGAALRDASLAPAVRIHLPRTLSRFGGQQAADVLLAHLLEEPSGAVRFKILRGLGRLIADEPQLTLDGARVDDVIERQLNGCLQVLRWRILLQRGAEESSNRRTLGYQLLADLLQQKETLAIERLFRALGLKYPNEDLARVHDALGSEEPEARSTGRELLHGLLPPRLRNAVVALVDEIPDVERLVAAKDFFAVAEVEYEALLGELVADGSITLRSIAAYHAGEIGLAQVQADGALAVDDAFAGLRSGSFDPPLPLKALAAGAAHAS